MGNDLSCKNIQKHGEWAFRQNQLHDEGKGVRKEIIFSMFRLNIVLHDSNQADEIDMEIEE